MPKERNPFIRTLVTVVVILAGVGIAFAVFRTSKPSAPPAQPPAQGTAAPSPVDPAATQPPAQSAQPPAPVAPPQYTIADPWSLRALVHPDAPDPSPLGSVDPGTSFRMCVEFTEAGAGLAALQLTDHFETIRREKHIVPQAQLPVPQGAAVSRMVPFAAMGLEVTPPPDAAGAPRPPILVNVFADALGKVWRADPAQPGVFEATIVDQDQRPILRLRREYSLAQGSSTILLRQRVENLVDLALTVRWIQTGPIDLPQDSVSYGGDKRKVRMGYLLPARLDPSRNIVEADDYNIAHSTALGDRSKAGGLLPEVALWPTQATRSSEHELVWAGMTNRYFGAAAYADAPPTATGTDKTVPWLSGVVRIVEDLGPASIIALRLDGKPLALPPSGALDLPLRIYAGPLDISFIKSQPEQKSLGLDALVVYNFGGPCGFCTFAFLTRMLLGLLQGLHDHVFKDWSLAIIFLVLVVRTILHPVTKWSQIRMARFGKQMQGMAPKQKALQEKFRDDPKKMQGEMARLWKEEGISPTGMLGCIPMFLQTPVWIALSAMLYFAVEIRHQGAFYGLFQKLQPGGSPFWQFLGDLAEPDRLLYAGGSLFNAPMIGPIDGLNVLPIIMGVVFFIQQKYLTPPQPAGTMTPEQELQMKITKWMMVFMFPLFMYNAPSGLALYFTVNSTLGILESKWIRSHMDKHGLLDLDKLKARALARRKPGRETFLERVQRVASEQQKHIQQRGQGKSKK